MTDSVAFIGAGAIGLPMVGRIAGGGFEVDVVERAPERRAEVRSAGLRVTDDVAVCGRHDTVLVMVATPEQLASALSGPVGALAHMRRGSTCIVMSTVGARAIEEVKEESSVAGVELLDIPVTGGVAGAEEGRLKLFASGPREAVNRCADVLACLGEVIYCGSEPGSGQLVKLVNQLLCSVHLAAAAEALAYAESLGLDPAAVLAAMQGGAAGSWMLSNRGPRMLMKDRVPVTSTVSIFEKDSSLVAAAAEGAAFHAPLLTAAAGVFARARVMGLSDLDDSQVIRVYRAPDAGRESTGAAKE